MAPSHDALWLSTGAFLGTLSGVLAGIAGVLDGVSKVHYSLWTSAPMIVAYVMIGLAAACLACAARGIPYPAAIGEQARREVTIGNTESSAADAPSPPPPLVMVPQSETSESQWAALVGRLNEIMGWKSWQADLAGIFIPDVQRMDTTIEERFNDAAAWISNRVWPDGHPRIRSAIEALARALNDFIMIFELYAEGRRGHSEEVRTAQFYKIKRWDPKLYTNLLGKYSEHVALVEDLALELTRYGNYIATLVREEIDSSFRFEDGALLISWEPGNDFVQRSYKPEFATAELGNGEPYVDLEQFNRDRSMRALSAKRRLDGGDFAEDEGR